MLLHFCIKLFFPKFIFNLQFSYQTISFFSLGQKKIAHRSIHINFHGQDFYFKNGNIYPCEINYFCTYKMHGSTKTIDKYFYINFY